MSNQPLVTIGIPTYNRCDLLLQSIESIQNQTYRHLEILISDNCSTDTTYDVVNALKNTDSRISYVRHQKPIPLWNNFSTPLNQASGEYFMWLADDDLISPSYVESCMDFLINHPGYSLAAGVTVPYPKESLPAFRSITGDFNSPKASDRCLAYYRAALPSINGLFYGISKTADLRKLESFHCVGTDLLWTSQLCLLGKVRVLDDISWNFRLGGTSASLSKTARSFRLSRFWIRFPALNFAYNAAKCLLSSPLAKREMTLVQRLCTALSVFICILQTHGSLRKEIRSIWMDSKYRLIMAIKTVFTRHI